MQDEIYEALSNHRDERIQSLIKGEISTDILSALFSAHITEEMDPFEIQYLAPGLSGAGIISVSPAKGAPFIIKYGCNAIIEREKNNYKKIGNSIPNHLLTGLKSEGKKYRNYNSIAFSWAGGRNKAENIREYFGQEKDIEKLRSVVSSLMNNLFQWCGKDTTPRLPIDQWEWKPPETINAVHERIDGWDQDDQKKKRLSEALHRTERWRDALRNRAFSSGYCHGDLNYRNILVVHDGKNIFPVLIDFASICEGVSPAMDWAKFEREIKFRLLRDAEPDPAVFRKALQEIETCCDTCTPFHVHPNLEKALNLISLIRSKYSERRTNISDAPHLEYLFFLFYTTLAYAVHGENEGKPLVQHAVLDSAYRILEQIDRIISSDIEYKYPGITGTEAPADVTPPVILQVPEAYRTWIETHCLKTELGKLVEDQDQEIFVRIRQDA